ncbi:phage tail sheath C-terminal domain-containing protein [Amycolatopsis nigrescens]|uniref:phage tail sheath C-terminal domain-containing protein n=1 Tax=Amycolatopsis nigrescens TaxID=381445 RepID=UPI00036CFDB1|nr:phage tail sheath C-terminal domain-containing protein [Amycolatopsis nigrescens]
MTEAVLPGVLIEVRPEALIVPGAITVGNVGVIGTAAKGPVNVPQLLGSYAAAVATFGPYDRWNNGTSDELTLVRAIEQAYKFGATTVWAVRVAAPDPNEPAYASGTVNAGTPAAASALLTAASPGTWGNELTVQVVGTGQADAFVRDEEVTFKDGKWQLAAKSVKRSAVNRLVIKPASGTERVPAIVYEESQLNPTRVLFKEGDGTFTFGTPPVAGDTVLVSYAVAKANASKVVVKAGVTAEEVYNVISGTHLAAQITASSALVKATPAPAPGKPDERPGEQGPTPLAGGTNGQTGALYSAGLDALNTVDAHLIVAAGQNDRDFGDDLAAHCDAASGDEIKRERIAIVGTAAQTSQSTMVTHVTGHTQNSDRLVLVAPGIAATDRGADPVTDVTLPGAYTAAAIAGMLAAQPPHISLTNKVLQVGGLEYDFTSAELKQLVLSRALTLEKRQGFRIVRGITTSTNTAWTQITTRRIVDYAKLGVRSAATPFIGLLNNERVRNALRATINGFLSSMVEDEMLVSYELDVHASREDEIRGRVLVDMVIRPTFSIDFIKVTMFLE